MFKSNIKSPIDGKIINISNVTGQVVVSEHPIPINVDAYIPGKIKNLYDLRKFNDLVFEFFSVPIISVTKYCDFIFGDEEIWLTFNFSNY